MFAIIRKIMGPMSLPKVLIFIRVPDFAKIFYKDITHGNDIGIRQNTARNNISV
jgi:hypothetical protein